MMNDKKMLGEILVSAGIISETTMKRALEKAKMEKIRIGLALEDMGVVTGDEIADALSSQFKLKRTGNIQNYRFPPDLLSRISVDTALQHLIFPLKIENGMMYLAMADPTERKVLGIIEKNNNVKILPFIATRKDIVAAINKHYMGNECKENGKKTVLIVEDNAAVRLELEKSLGKQGYRIISAKDGIEAFQKAISDAPDVILTDKSMPRLDGYRLLESLKAVPETKRIPVILLTATLEDGEEEETFAKGFFDYMVKPVKPSTLATRVKRAIQASAPRH